MSQGPLHLRIRQLLSASVETVVTAAEGVSGSALLGEAMRELDRAEERLRRDRSDAEVRRDQAEADQRARQVKAAEMADHARYALTKSREDLATQALSQQHDLEVDAARLAEVCAAAKVDIRQIGEALAELAARRETMRADIAVVRRNSSGTSGKPASPSPKSKVELAVARANQMIERATGASTAPIGDRASAKGVADIAAMRRDDSIAERLAAMKAGSASRPTKTKTIKANR